MALDRFVYWKKNKRSPSLKRLREVLEDYLGDAAVKVELADRNRIIALLRGRPTFPFRRVHGYKDMGRVFEKQDERWIEVYRHTGAIDVITRLSDEYTNVVAEGFAKLCARFWQGRYKHPD